MALCISAIMAKRRFSWLASGAFVVLLTAAVSWVWAHAGHHALPTKGVDTSEIAQGKLTVSRASRDVLDVQTVEVQPRTLAERVLAYATLVTPWQQHAYVTTRLPGRITKLHVRPGQAVAAGQSLAEVQSLELENLQLELLNAQNDVQLSARVVDELEPLAKQQAIPERDFREARAKHRQNVNAVEIARAKWRSLGLSQESLEKLLHDGKPQLLRALPILSPIMGTVIHVDLTVGRVVEPTEHLFEIVDLSKVWVKIGVLEQDLHKIDVGQPVELTLPAYPGEVYRSTVQVKGSYLDPQTHLGTAWAELSNPSGQEPRLLPGMYGQAQVLLPAPNKLPTVPATALIADGAERYVLVENTNTAKSSEYQKRDVVGGLQSGQFVQLREGEVYAGDRVVTTGSHELSTFFVQGVLRLSPEAAKNIGLRLEPARLHVVEDVLEVDGAVEVPPDRRAFASTQLAGTLQKISAERGQTVHAGDILGEVASLELQNLQLELVRSHLQIGLLEETLQRLRQVDQIVARKQLWETESLYNETRNRRDSLQRKLESIGLSREQVQAILTEKKIVVTLPVRTPIDGIVVHFDKVLGQVIKAEEPLFEIHDLSHAWVKGYLSEREQPQVRIGQQARVRFVSDPSLLIEATVTRSGWVFGVENRTLEMWVKLDRKPAPTLQHNMLARLTLTQRRPEPTLAVPLAAVVREGTRAYLFIQKPDGLIERRPVDTGRADDRHVEITRGLRQDEQVAVGGTADLQTAYASLR